MPEESIEQSYLPLGKQLAANGINKYRNIKEPILIIF
jgi:hypothetical protein